jgi:hypothetical protein
MRQSFDTTPFFIIEKPEMIDMENVSTTQRYLGKVSDVEALSVIGDVRSELA